MCSFISVLPCPGCSQERQRGSTNSSSSQAPLITTITSAPNSTKGFTPSARTISKPARASPASSIVLAMTKERKRRMIATRTVTTRTTGYSGVTPQADARIIRVWKDERVVGVVSLGGRFLQAPCRGTLCTFDLARLPGFYTCQDDELCRDPQKINWTPSLWDSRRGTNGRSTTREGVTTSLVGKPV